MLLLVWTAGKTSMAETKGTQDLAITINIFMLLRLYSTMGYPGKVILKCA